MYSIGDVVMYGTFGICKIVSIEKRDFTGEENDYYILRHVYNEKNTFYVPVNNELALSKLHKVCSKADVNELIGHMNAEAPIWIDNEIKRKEEYSRIIKGGDKKEIIRLIKALYLRRKELYAEKKNSVLPMKAILPLRRICCLRSLLMRSILTKARLLIISNSIFLDYDKIKI